MTAANAANTVVFNGELSIRASASLHGALLDACQGAMDVTVDCSAATDADLSFLQLLLAARRSMRAKGGRLCLVASPPVAAAMSRAGLPAEVFAPGAGA